MSSVTTLPNGFDVAASRRRCLQRRRRILEVSQKVSALHIAGAFSCVEILDVIYFGLMRRKADGSAQDSFILSKGHASIGQYVILEELGVLKREEVDGYCKSGSKLGEHPDRGTAGIEASTGSLGHGLPLALGMALADKVLRVDRRVYLAMSDGELQEGSVWESMMLAPTFGLTEIIAFVDSNDYQTFGPTSKTHPNFYPLLDKVRAFGWESVEVKGHDPGELYRAAAGRRGNAPLMVIAKTTKGKGVSYMENVPLWHYRSPSPEEYQTALRELSREIQ